jgi:hypothetical protein
MAVPLEGEDLEVALAGKNDGEGAAVGREGIFADGEAVKEDVGVWFGDGNLGVGGIGPEAGDAEQGKVGGAFFDGALQEEAGFIGGPLEDAEANAEPRDAEGISEIADFEDFLVQKVGNEIAAGRDGDAAGVGVESGDLFILLGEEIEALKARGPFETRRTFDSDAGVAAGDASGAFEGAAFEGFADGAGADIQKFEGEEALGIIAVSEVGEGLIVAQPDGELRVGDESVFSIGADFAAGVLEKKEGGIVFAGAGVGVHGSGEEGDGDDVGIGRPGEGFNLIGEKGLAVGEFLAFEDALALSAGLHEPNVVALEVVFFGFEHAADREDDAAVWGVGERGDFLVDGDGGLVEVLSGCWKWEEAEEKEESGEWRVTSGERSKQKTESGKWKMGERAVVRGFVTARGRRGAKRRDAKSAESRGEEAERIHHRDSGGEQRERRRGGEQNEADSLWKV